MRVNSFILMGNWFERSAIVNKIKSAMGEYDLSIFDETYSWEYVRQELLDNPCFGENQLIIINGLPKVSGKDLSGSRTKVLNDLKSILPKIEGSKCVILNGITISNKTFLDAVNGKIQIKKFDNVVAKSGKSGCAVNRMKKYLAEHNKQISDEDAIFAVDSINYHGKEVSLDKVFLLAQKIENLLGTRKNITHDDILSVCISHPDFLIWNLFKAFDKQDYKQILKLIDQIAINSTNFEHEIAMALSTMVWKYRMMLFVKHCLSKGFSLDDIWQRLSRFVKWDKTGSGMKRFVKPQMTKKDKKTTAMYSKMAMNMLVNNRYDKPSISCYSEDQIMKILTMIQIGLKKMRSGCSKGEIKIIFEIIGLVICNQVPYNIAKEILKNNYCL